MPRVLRESWLGRDVRRGPPVGEHAGRLWAEVPTSALELLATDPDRRIREWAGAEQDRRRQPPPPPVPERKPASYWIPAGTWLHARKRGAKGWKLTRTTRDAACDRLVRVERGDWTFALSDYEARVPLQGFREGVPPEPVQPAETAPEDADPAQAKLATPRVICGIPLNQWEAYVFEQAVKAGELVIPLHLPLASKLDIAFRKWCQANHKPCFIREEREVKVGND